MRRRSPTHGLPASGMEAARRAALSAMRRALGAPSQNGLRRRHDPVGEVEGDPGAELTNALFAAVEQKEGVGAVLAQYAAARLGAAGAVTVHLDGEGAAQPIGALHDEASPPIFAWEAADQAARTGVAALEHGGAIGAPIRMRGRAWGGIAVWGAEHGASTRTVAATAADLSSALTLAAERIELAGRAREEAALRRIATAIASGRELAALHSLVVEEASLMLDADAVAIFTVDERGSARLEQAFTRPRPVETDARDTVSRALSSQHAARSESGAIGNWLGATYSIAAPITVRGAVRGALVAERTQPTFAPGAEDLLTSLGELAGLAILNSDRRAALSAEARIDHLTGLGNRRAFSERLSEEVERARRYGHALGLVLIDIDDFKAINDTFGHPLGDDVLAEVARRLSSLGRAGELVARIGGDELAWLLPETDAEGAARAAQRALDSISSATFSGVGALSASAGVADLTGSGGPSDLVRRADAALLRSKVEGPGVVRRAGEDDDPPALGGGAPHDAGRPLLR
jgi:diguanylate cyclase (GGDEF)-like protein